MFTPPGSPDLQRVRPEDRPVPDVSRGRAGQRAEQVRRERQQRAGQAAGRERRDYVQTYEWCYHRNCHLLIFFNKFLWLKSCFI